jgi:hypothetical protein
MCIRAAKPTVDQSSYNIGRQLILDGLDLIFELQLPLFQPLDLKLVGVPPLFQRKNLFVEVAMLHLELSEKFAQFTFIRSLHPAMLIPLAQ